MSTMNSKYQTSAERSTIANLDQRLQAVEKELNELNAQQRSHLRARKKDAREIVQRGDTVTLVVITPPKENDGTHAISKIEGVYTFIDANFHNLNRGDKVYVRIVDVGDNHAEAVLLDHIDQTEVRV